MTINYRPLIESLALWLKEQAHAVRVIGGIFLLLALVLGIVWSMGVELEPIAFVLSLLASVFLSLPSVAEYILPDRKPIRHMSFDELLRLIDEEEPSAWKVLHTDWAAEAFLRSDPRLRFRTRNDEVGVECDDFKEPWANQHPNPRAITYWYDYFYDGNLIERFILVDVDGNRATLPLPKPGTTYVPMRLYRIAKIFERNNEVDDYMQRSGLSIHDS
ncbi:hypothetical protein [Halomonas sp. N3-2A]|uniref:hypothetical protein n=1 Tax=Halomonas sp. N3-2A TaxID=2014541 RepID=UPI000B5B206C|nr:hypothetical protein [Halomonas sp. N3-2A]ASK18050.1 hypothetical protein CEK60_01485 [Halomonas sp. N3-2A]